MTQLNNRFALLAILMTLAGASTQVQAQDAFVSLDLPPRPAAAAEIERQAGDLLPAVRGWDRAAGLYVRAAELRGSGDMQSAGNLWIAGYLQFYRGRASDAIVSLTRAGEAFLALGDVERAAEAFIDGAWVAARAQMSVEAVDLSERGRRLTQSPLLAVEERMALVRRLGAAAGTQ